MQRYARAPLSNATSSGGITWISQSFRGIRRARPTRDRSSTGSEHTARIAGLADTMSWSNVPTSAGRMPIANVSQLCGCEQGWLWALTLPLMSTVPCQHSGSFGQRAAAIGTDEAGHPLVTVGMPNPPGRVLIAAGPSDRGRVPDPALGVCRYRPTATAAAAMTRARPPPTRAAARAAGCQRGAVAAAPADLREWPAGTA